MRAIMRNTSLHKTSLCLALSSSLLLAACGGSNDSAPPAATLQGTFTDSPVAGLHYTASPSGLSGSTDSSGHFDYRSGDTITFKVGGITLGSTSSSTGMITPIELANAVSGASDAEKANRVTNLLVLLQSLDTDGDANNGIEISNALATAITNTSLSIDLNQDPAAFTSFTALVAALNALPDLPGTIIATSPANATAHFSAQLLKALKGNWIASNPDFANTATPEIEYIEFDENGNYAMVHAHALQGDGTHSGSETGHISVDATTGVVDGTTTHSTIGTWGLGAAKREQLKFRINSDGDIVASGVDADDANPVTAPYTFTFKKVNSTANSIAGAWGFVSTNGSSTNNGTRFIFLPDGKYLMLDIVGDTEVGPGDPSCGGPGAELGTYSFNSDNTLVRTAAIIYDTNGCAGMHDNTVAEASAYSSPSFSVSADGNTLTLTGGGDSYVFARNPSPVLPE